MPSLVTHDFFVLNARSRELRIGERSITLQAQPFEVLLLLLDRAGEVVDREELRQRLWPEGTFVDYEHCLNAAIKRLRAALGDHAGRPQFIETIPRRGYRLVAPLSHTAARITTFATRANSMRLAVLPVTYLGADRYFAEGLAEELRTQIARLSAGAVAVIARSSSTAFEGQPHRASEIGEKLNAHYLVESSVRSDADRLRVTAGLIAASDETHVWNDVVECRVEGPLSAQVAVATRLAQSLTRKLLAAA